MVIAKNKNCLICGNEVESLIKLPNFPITGVFSDKYDENFPVFDQELQFCKNCNHCQLKNIIEPDFLYSKQYSFLTSNSSNSMDSTINFIEFINEYLPMSEIDSIVEFGCNDLYFLKQFSKHNIESIGIDPILKDIEVDDNIVIIADYIENIDLKSKIKSNATLICSQHTIEHIFNPIDTLKKLKNISDVETLFAFEFPNFDLLVQNRRYDQIFHEHIHYFSLDSFKYLLEMLDFTLIDFKFNYNKWGSIYVLFKNKASKVSKNTDKYKMSKEKIISGYNDFQNLIDISKNVLDQFSENEKYAYGASLMLPSLNYHFDGYLSKLNSVLDDDKNKKNKSYINLGLKIDVDKKEINYSDSVFLITALEHTRNITKTLTKKNAKNIIVPINIF